MVRTVALIVVIALAAPVGPQDLGYVLRAEDVACLQANAEAYRALTGDPLFVAVTDCPEIPRNPLLGVLTNEGPDVKLSEELPYDSFVYLTRDQLDCLLTAEASPGAALYGVSLDGCVLEPRE